MRHLRRSVSTTAVVPRRTSVRTTPHLHRSIDESPRSLRRRLDAGNPAAACGHSDRRRRAARREDWRTHLRARPLDRAPHRGDRGEVSRGEWIRRDRGIQSRPATGPVEPSSESRRSKRRRHQPSRRSNTEVKSATRSRSTPLRRPPSRGDEPRCSIDRSRPESNPRSPDFEVLEVAIRTRKRREPSVRPDQTASIDVDNPRFADRPIESIQKPNRARSPSLDPHRQTRKENNIADNKAFIWHILAEMAFHPRRKRDPSKFGPSRLKSNLNPVH